MGTTIWMVFGVRVPYHNLVDGAKRRIRELNTMADVGVVYSRNREFAVIGDILGEMPYGSKESTTTTKAVDTEVLSRIPRAVGMIGIDRLRAIPQRLWLVLGEQGDMDARVQKKD